MNGPKDAERGPHEAWCDTQNMISERCNCMASSYIDQIEEHLAAMAEKDGEIERINEQLETERMRLAACGVAAMQNTNESRSERIDKNNPYWSASYRDVCRAVDSEIEHRETIARQAQELTEAREMVEKARELYKQLLSSMYHRQPMQEAARALKEYDNQLNKKAGEKGDE